MKKLLAFIFMLILPAAAGGLLGYFMGFYLSNFNPRIALAVEIRQISERTLSGDLSAAEKASLAAKEFLKTPGANDPSFLYAEAAGIKRKFALGGFISGVWLGIVFFLKALAAGRGRRYLIREPESSLCVSCARCFRSCPIERERLKKIGAEKGRK